MRLVDHFLPLLALTAYLSRKPDQLPPDYAAVRQDCLNLLGEAAGAVRTAGFSAEDFDAARFAVCAWLDEAVLVSNWPGRDEWAREPLQRHYYHTSNAGEEFFRRLESLSPDNPAVREVFATCLALGFKGRYFDERRSTELARVEADNLVALWGDTFDAIDLADGWMFPDAYPRAAGRRRRKRWPATIFLSILIPPAAVLTLFVLYRLFLNEAIFDFFRTAL